MPANRAMHPRMKRRSSIRAGFSLMEVATAIGVISFALVALVGMFPVGLDNSRRCVSETRATELLKMVVTTLQSEPFEAAPCFAPASSAQTSKLDLRTIPATTTTTKPLSFSTAPDVLLYASYDIRDIPQVVRVSSAASKPAEAIYLIELRFSQQLAPVAPTTGSTTTTTTTPRIAGSIVDLRLRNAVGKETVFAETQAFIPNFTRSAYSPYAP